MRWPWQRLPAEPRVDPQLARELLTETTTPPPFPGVAGIKTTPFEQQKCQHCGGLHVRNCPRVKEVEYHADGSVKRVSYWPHGEWPEDQVLFLDDVQDAAATPKQGEIVSGSD